MLRMNITLFRFTTILAIMILMVSGSGCMDTFVKTQTGNKTETLMIEGGGEIVKQEVNTEWEIFFENFPQYRGIDLYRNPGYGITKITLDYLPSSGRGTISLKKMENDWQDKSKIDHHVSGIRLLLQKESGEVYDTGIIIIPKNETLPVSISLPGEKFMNFKVEELLISN